MLQSLTQLEYRELGDEKRRHQKGGKEVFRQGGSLEEREC